MKQPKQSKEKRPQKSGAAEAIIAVQSVMLLLIGIAGILSASTIVAGFKAITDANSAAVLITDSAIQTDTGEQIPIERVEGIINNFHIVCAIALTIGGIVALASGIRLLLKQKN